MAEIPGSLLGGVIADRWGKKLTMCTSNLLAYGLWLVVAFANNKYLLLLSYSLQGFFAIMAYNLIGKNNEEIKELKEPIASDLLRDLYR